MSVMSRRAVDVIAELKLCDGLIDAAVWNNKRTLKVVRMVIHRIAGAQYLDMPRNEKRYPTAIYRNLRAQLFWIDL